MPSPDDRTYSDSHEWHKVEDDVLTLGLTQFAVDQLTDVTFVEMKDVGTTIGPGDAVGEVESVKTTSDIYCAAGGEIIEINERLDDEPGLVNSDPYGDGWLIKLKITDQGSLPELMTASVYDSKYA